MQPRELEEQTTIPLNNQIENSNGNGQGTVDFAELLDHYEYPQPKQGQILDGEVMRIEEDVLYINIGAKRDAIVPHTELQELDERYLNKINQGDQVPVYVTKTPVGDEELVVSLKKGLQREDWNRAEAHLEGGEEILELEIVQYNKGGLLVEFGQLQGFIPNSHVPELRHIRNPEQRKSFKSKQIGQSLAVKVLEVDRDQRRLVMSATTAEKEQRKEQLKALKEGEVVTGRVAHLVKYGAFVDLGSVDGLVHISKLAWEHVEDPADFISVGDEIEVLIEEVDVERERISLNRKALIPTPWDSFAQKHEPGDLVEGVVTGILDFGAFIQLPSGIEGLAHISEINGNPAEVLEPGNEVLARVISIEPERERLGLSLRRVSATEEITWMAERSVDEEVLDEEE